MVGPSLQGIVILQIDVISQILIITWISFCSVTYIEFKYINAIGMLHVSYNLPHNAIYFVLRYLQPIDVLIQLLIQMSKCFWTLEFTLTASIVITLAC